VRDGWFRRVIGIYPDSELGGATRFIVGILWIILLVFIILVFLNRSGIR
jgi:hypothetical protein